MCEKRQKSIRWKLVVFEVKVLEKSKTAEIVVRGSKFVSPYRGRQSRYSRYFTVVDSPLTRLQDDQKSSVYGWKCPHYRRSNLWDGSKTTFWGQLSRNPEVRTSKFCSSPENFLRTSVVCIILVLGACILSSISEIFVCGAIRPKFWRPITPKRVDRISPNFDTT